MKRLLTILCIPALLLLGAAEAGSADLQKGKYAYDTGDYAAALREWRPLAEQGHAKAQVNLGFMYHSGEGVAEDDAQAVEWTRKAAEQGHADAQFNLALAYDEGEGVAEDDAQAVEWYRKAAEQGDEDAAKHRDKLAKSMTPDQIAEAQRLAREWTEKHSK